MMGSKDQMLPISYYLSDVLFALMFLRVYFLIRTLLNFTSYSDLYSKKVAVKHGVEPSTGFFVRALYAKETGLVIVMTSTISIAVLAYVLRIFERVYYSLGAN